MKNKLTALIMLTIILTGISLNAWSQFNDKLKEKIQKINTEMMEAMMAEDHDKMMAFYAEDAISLPSYEPMLVGLEAIKKSNEQMMSSGMKMKSVKFTTKEVQSCGDMIIEVGNYNISMEMPMMEQPVNDMGKYITIWEKQADGSLKIKMETWNTDMNPMEQFQAGNQ